MDDGKPIFRGTRLEWLEKLAHTPRPVLAGFGAYWIAQTQRAFREQRRGEHAWKPRMTPNVAGMLRDFERGPNVPKRRFRDRPALVDTSELRSSIAYRFVRTNVIEVGSPMPYAGVQQQGGKVEIDVTRTMKRNLWMWMKREAGKMAGGGLVAGITKAEKRDVNKLKKDRSASARRLISKRFGWIFGLDVFEMNVRSRPFVVVTRDDRAKLRNMVASAMRQWRGEGRFGA